MIRNEPAPSLGKTQRLNRDRKASPYRQLRLLGALAAIVVSVGIVALEYQYRSLESAVVSWWMDGLIPGGTQSAGDHILMYLPLGEQFASSTPVPYAGTPEPELIALHITAECASYVAVIPLLILSGFFIGATRVQWLRWLLGTLAGAIGIFAVNQIRLAVIVFSTSTWGMQPGYEISHILVGSIIGLFGFIACFFLALRIMNPKVGQQRKGRGSGPVREKP